MSLYLNTGLVMPDVIIKQLLYSDVSRRDKENYVRQLIFRTYAMFYHKEIYLKTGFKWIKFKDNNRKLNLKIWVTFN